MKSPAICTILLLAVAAFAATDGQMLRSVAELDDFANDPSRRYTPFCVTGTVQSVGAPSGLIVVSDASGWVEIHNESAYSPVPGEKIALVGNAHMSAHQEIDISANDISHVGTDMVEPPIELPLGAIIDERNHLRVVITEGTVIDAFPDEIDSKYQFLLLRDAGDTLPVAMRVDAGSNPDNESLRDARVRVSGRFMRTVSGGRKFSGPFISVEDSSAIDIVDEAPKDPFAAPPLEKALYRTPKEIAGWGKRSISGEVLAAWGGNRLMARTAEGRIVNVTLAHGQSAPRPGETVTVAGYPETDLFRVNLSRAIVRAEPNATESCPESEITDIETIFSGPGGPNSIDPACHGRLLRLTGVVQGIPSPGASEMRLLLVCGTFKLHVDLGTCPDAAADIAIGSEIEVTGRCLLEIDSWNQNEIFPRIRNLVAIIRTPEDLRIISSPPWWTPMRLLVVISLLATALVGVFLWNRFLQRLVNRRGRELYREQVAHAIAEFKTGERTRLAVELHDSLSQTLAGVACQIAAGARTMDKNPTVARRCIETADKMLNSCRTELRQCLFDLRSDTLEEADFAAAIRKTLDQLDGNASVTIRFDVPRERLKDTTAHAILAIIRELAANAIRHGEATEITVEGSMDGGLIRFSVTDNGHGFDPTNCGGPKQGHFGLEGIRNRLARLDGTMTIASSPGAGTKADIQLGA